MKLLWIVEVGVNVGDEQEQGEEEPDREPRLLREVAKTFENHDSRTLDGRSWNSDCSHIVARSPDFSFNLRCKTGRFHLLFFIT